MPTSSEPLIDAAHAAFIQGAVGISAAACGSDRMPALVRALGCRVSADRRCVAVFVSATQAAQLLKCIRDNGAVAVVFSEPSTHRTVQLKGADATVGELQEGDLQRLQAYRDAFAQEVAPHGFNRHMIQTLLSHPPADIVALAFTPTAAFSQTPGPKAGAPLGAGA